MDNLARKEVIDQVPFGSPLDDEPGSRFKSVTEFLDHVEMGVRDFVRYLALLLAVYFFNHGWGKIIRRVAYRDI